MKIHILAVGRLKGPEQELCERYLRRSEECGTRLGIRSVQLACIGEARAGSAGERKRREGEQLARRLPQKAVVIALDEKGQSFSSVQFADHLSSWREQEGRQALAFVLGGPDGHDQSVLAQADLKLSLSPLTLPHGLARVVLLEQLYRAITIAAGHPYHRA